MDQINLRIIALYTESENPLNPLTDHILRALKSALAEY